MESMTVDFVALDFETANRSPASACAVGLVRVRGGKFVDQDAWLIRPPSGHDEFAPFNVQLHGISAERVSRAPNWQSSLDRILEFTGDDVLVAHNAPFDIGVLVAASRATRLPIPALNYFCTLRLARRSYQLPSYSLPSAAKAAGYQAFKHHDALADAEACAAIVVDVAQQLGTLSIEALSVNTGVHIRRLHADNTTALDALVADATF